MIYTLSLALPLSLQWGLVFLCELDLSLSIQFLFFSPSSSADDPISAVLMQQMDSLPQNIHHMPHQNLPLLHFAPVKNEHPPPFFQDNKSRLPCHQKRRWSRLRCGKFLFSVVSHSQSENTTRQWGNSGASLIQLNPPHYYANEPNSAHLIFTEICCWPERFNCLARTLIYVKNADQLCNGHDL